MKFPNSMMLLGASLLCAPAAFAQDTAAPAQATPAPTTAAPAPISDVEVTKFATAALAVEKVRKDATIADADKNAKMADAVKAAGLEATRFNEIGQAMQADPALNKRIQTAAAAQMPATPAPQ